MLAEIFLGALILTVAVLVAVDVGRTKSEGPHGHADGAAHDSRPQMAGATRGRRTEAFAREPARVAIPAAGPAGDTARPADSGLSAAGRHPSAHGEARRVLTSWHVRSRLLLLAGITATAVAAIASCVVGMVSIMQGTPIHSASGSVRDRAVASALVLGVVVIIVLALGSWLAIGAARSILQPLYRVRAGAVEMAEGRLPDEVRRVSEGEDVPADLTPIAVDSPDEIGDIARAVGQMRREILRLAAYEATYRGKLDAIFVNLSHRGQSLVERQIRLIQHLERGERNPDRLAGLDKVSRIATRMHRNSQNLLILAGYELSSSWNQPVALVDVIRAAVSETEEYERVSLRAQPDIAVRGPVVSDAVRLFAELTENATSFSAADMLVDISGSLLDTGGALVEITDRGVGMGAKEMAYANWQLDNPSAVDVGVTKWMGLFVVARLAARHGIRVRLQPAQFGGLTALVWLPDDVITRSPNPAATPRSGGAGGLGPGPGPHEAAGPGRSGLDQNAPTATLTPAAPSRRGVPDAPLGQPVASQPGQDPSQEDFATRRRLPIFDSVESRWFRDGREAPDSSTAAGGGWSSPADEGWHAARTVSSPPASAPTAAGLPRRQPSANLIPGAIPGPQLPLPDRSASAARDRFTAWQRGVSEGRAAASETADPDAADEP